MDKTRNIDLALLRTFIVVAETESLRAASRIVERTTSAVFYQIERLEEVLKYKLFIRNKGRLTSSEVGDRFLKQAHALLKHHD